MGRPKAGLDWHGSTLLRRVVGLVQRGVDGQVVVVRAPGQALPRLPVGVEVLDDPYEGRGPLQGIAVGLSALVDAAATAFVCSTDLPLLHPAFVRRVTRDGDGADVVLPHVHGHRQPLAACYRTSLSATATQLVAQDRLRPAFLLDGRRVIVLDEQALLKDAALRTGDPGLDSVCGVNTPEEYAAARDRPLPSVRVQCSGVLARAGGHAQTTLLAATLGVAAAAVGVALDRRVLAAVNGDQATRDPELPLVAGDEVVLLSADAGG
jgi:molybdopterin-guanine dinucleotide biosynthesis protein A